MRLVWLLFVFWIFVACTNSEDTDDNTNNDPTSPIDPVESEIRFGYGLMYENWGKMLHGLNKYYLVIGLQIPSFAFIWSDPFHVDRPIDYFDSCDLYKNMTLVYKVCTDIWPIYYHHRRLEVEYQRQIIKIVQEDLPAILPNYGNGKNNRKNKKNRQKRFIGPLVSAIGSLGFQAIDTFLTARKTARLQKGLDILTRRQLVTVRKLYTVANYMMTVAKVHAGELAYLNHELNYTNSRITLLAQELVKMQDYVRTMGTQVTENSNAIRYVSSMMGVLMGEVERSLSMYQHLMAELDHFLDALDNLSNGLLSHTVLPPNELKRLLNHVSTILYREYPQYELVINQVHHYYNLPLATFGYRDGMVAIQVPLFVKLTSQKPLNLYNVRTVPVPYHINPDLINSTENANAYTWLRPSHPLLAMSESTYIPLTIEQLQKCFHFGHTYFCEQSFVLHHKEEHTCESAIYWKLDNKIITDICDFDYYDHLVPEPTVLDAGNYMLLAGLPIPWRFYCHEEHQMPSPISGGAYIIIKKADLCLCSISAGNYYLQENIVHCKDDLTGPDMVIYHTVNMAVGIFEFPKHISFHNITAESLFEEPPQMDPTDPKIFEEHETGVIRTNDDTCPAVSYKDIVYNKNNDILTYLSKEDKALEMNNPSSWFSGDNIWFGVMLIGAMIGIVAIIIAIIIALKHIGLHSRFTVANGLLSKLMGVAALTPVSTAKITDPISTKFISYWPEGLILVVYVVLVMCAIIVLYRCTIFILDTVTLNSLYFQKLSTSTWYSKFTIQNKSQIMLEITCHRCAESVFIYLGSYVGSPTRLEAFGEFFPSDFLYRPGYIYDSVSISWSHVKVKCDDEEVFLPACIQIPFFKKYKCRKMVDNINPKFRFVAKDDNMVHPFTYFQRVRRHNIDKIASIEQLNPACRTQLDETQQVNPTYQSADSISSISDDRVSESISIGSLPTDSDITNNEHVVGNAYSFSTVYCPACNAMNHIRNANVTIPKVNCLHCHKTMMLDKNHKVVDIETKETYEDINTPNEGEYMEMSPSPVYSPLKPPHTIV